MVINISVYSATSFIKQLKLWQTAFKENIRSLGQKDLRMSVFSKDGRLIIIPVIIGLAILCYFRLSFEPPLFLVLGASAAIVSCFTLTYPFRDRSLKHEVLYHFFYGLILFAIGFSAASFNTHRLSTPILERELSHANVIGTIQSIELLERPQDYRILLSDLVIEKVTPEKTPKHVRIKVRGKNPEEPSLYKPGDRVEVFSGLNAPSPPVIPGGFDFQRFAYFRQIGGFGFAYKKPDIIQNATTKGIKHYKEIVRSSIADHIRSDVSADNQGVLIALMTGKRAAIEEQQWENLRNAGMAHMVAISGLHVGLMASVLFFSLRLVESIKRSSSPRTAINSPLEDIIISDCSIGFFIYTKNRIIITDAILICLTKITSDSAIKVHDTIIKASMAFG
jgi:competence protein ComEC